MKEFVAKLFTNVPMFDTGGRAATTTFVQREIGDVLITFESEMHGIGKEYGDDKSSRCCPRSACWPNSRGDRRQGRRRARHPRSGQDLSRYPLHAGGAGDHRRARQPADDKAVAAKYKRRISPRSSGDGGGCVRRLGQGHRRAFRRRRPARPGSMSGSRTRGPR